jgi:Cohesin domain
MVFFLYHFPAKPALLVFLGVLSLLIFIPIPQSAHGLGNLPFIGVWSSKYNTANFTDASLTAGSTFYVQVNVTNAPLFNSYEFALYYDQNYVRVTSYDLTTGTVFDSPYQGPGSFNGPGALRLSIVNLNNGNNNAGFYALGSGMLVNITFSVVKAGGVSPLVLAAGIAHPSSSAAAPGGLCSGCPAGSPDWTRLIADGNLPDGTALSSKIQVDTANGYFRNVALGNPGPVALFSVSPKNPIQGDTVTFNATASFDPDNRLAHNNGTAEYLWDFGDVSRDSNTTLFSPVANHAFISLSGAIQFTGNFSVRLTVVDADNGFQGMFVTQVTVSRAAQHCVTVETISTSVTRYNQGDNAIVSIRVKDAGTFPETYNLTVSYGPPNATLIVLKNENIRSDQSISYTETLSTSKLLPGVYNIIGIVQLAGAQNCSQGTNANQFIIAQPGTAPAVLLLVGGVVLIPSAAIALITLLRRWRRQPEPL